MITAYARIALDSDWTDVPPKERDISIYEKAVVSGEGETWEEAQAACVIPDGARVMAWARWPID